MEQASKYAFRLACARYFSQELLEKLSSSLNKLPNVSKDELSTLLKDDQCCESCHHRCALCKDECLNKPDCFKLPCDSCFLTNKDCTSEDIKEAVAVFQAISNINVKDCEKFIVEEKRFQGFPNSKSFAQIFNNYDTAIGSFSSYLLQSEIIDEDTHKDNLMYSRMIHRIPAKQLRYYVYHEVNFNSSVSEEELRKQPHQAGKKITFCLRNQVFLTDNIRLYNL